MKGGLGLAWAWSEVCCTRQRDADMVGRKEGGKEGVTAWTSGGSISVSPSFAKIRR